MPGPGDDRGPSRSRLGWGDGLAILVTIAGWAGLFVYLLWGERLGG